MLYLLFRLLLSRRAFCVRRKLDKRINHLHHLLSIRAGKHFQPTLLIPDQFWLGEKRVFLCYGLLGLFLFGGGGALPVNIVKCFG